MVNVPIGTELARPFVPAKNLELAKRFYLKVGFEIVLDSEVAVFRIGTSGFILSSFDQAENFMMQLMVDDLDAWWAHITSLDLVEEFGVPPPIAPALQPWGLRIAYLVDPSGVLWHVAQRRLASRRIRSDERPTADLRGGMRARAEGARRWISKP